MTDAVSHFPLHVTGITSRGVQCVTMASTDWPLWLPRGGWVTWKPEPEVGAMSMVAVPDWLAARHRQLSSVASVALESVKHVDTRKDANMAVDTRQDAGTGALFKNDRKERDNHPDYRGDCTITINGREMKLWVSSWIKTSKSGQKFMSLAFREADEPAKAKPKPAMADDDLPF